MTQLIIYPQIPLALQQYVATEILPQYDHFDAAHQRDHAVSVITESMALARHYDVNPAMVYTAAACHDLGLCEGRERHHVVSARIICALAPLRQWFSEEEIRTMAEAAEDHRASTDHEPRSIYGKIVAEADRLIDTDLVLERTVKYGLAHDPELRKEEHFQRMVHHLQEKYAEGGYLRLWIPESSNAKRLADLRNFIAQPAKLRKWFDTYVEEHHLFADDNSAAVQK